MPVFAHDGLGLTYSDTGAGPPFVFQHGLGADATQPATQAPEGWRLITLECRGHGATPLGREQALGFERCARDLDALLDQLGLGAVVLGGISMGAGVALALARLRPERVHALVLVRPAWLDRGSPPNLRVFVEIASLLRRHGAGTGKQLFLNGPAYRRAEAVSPALASSLVGQFERPHASERAAVLERIVADRPLAPTDWHLLTMPALVVGARRDSVHPFAYAQALKRRLPVAVLREVPPKDRGQAAHRAAVAQAIAAFLEPCRLRPATPSAAVARA